VQGYNEDGVLRWSTILEDYKGLQITYEMDGGLIYKADANGSHHIAASALSVDDNVLALQIGVISQESRSRTDLRNLETRFLSVSDGQPCFDRFPRLPK
jgi:hypothetical protein